MTTSDVQMCEKFVKAMDPQCSFVSVKSLNGGLSAQTIVVEIQSLLGERKKLVIRRPPPWSLKKNPLAASTEYSLLNKLFLLGLKVPKPIFLDQEGAFFGTPSLAVAYEDGATNFSPQNMSETLAQMAAELAKINKVTANDLTGVSIIKDTQIFPRKTEIDYSASEIIALNYLEQNWPIKSEKKAVLVHGDFWPGNLVWKNEKLKLVIDWEAAGLGDPLMDLAVSRLDVLWLYGKKAMDEFTEIYERLTKEDLTSLPHWDLWAAHRTGGKFALWASVYPALGRPDVTELTLREKHEYFVNQAFDKIDSL